MKRFLLVLLVFFLLFSACSFDVDPESPTTGQTQGTPPENPPDDPYAKYTAFTDPLLGLIVTPEIQEALYYASQNFVYGATDAEH